jgi:hypothetical protein
MPALSLLMASYLLQQNPVVPPPVSAPANETKEIRGVVVEVFTDGLLLVSVGDNDYAEKGDQFFLARGAGIGSRSVASAEIVSLGKRFSVAKVKSSVSGIKTGVGDRVSLPRWEERKRILDARMQQGGAITINGK